MFAVILTAVLRAHNVDPAGSGPVPFDKLSSIARHVRRELDQIGVTDAELHRCFDWLGTEVLDRSMTDEGLQLAINELAKGFGLTISLPN